jgi:site-specific DNA recombinase
MQKRAAINARVSGRVQEQEGYSLDDQVERCGLYCAARGYQVVHINREVASGGELDERDGMWQILKMIERGEVDVLVQTVLDRLARDHTHTEVLIYTAKKHGVSLEFVDETFDDSPEGRVMRAMKSVFADMDRQRITERLLRGRRSRARAGKLLATSIPLYGYRWSGDDKGAYVIHEETGQIVVRIYEWAAAGRVLM